MNAFRQIPKRPIIALIVALILGLTASAATAVDWAELTAEEQGVLLPFAEEWSVLTVEHREKLRAGARLWAAMTPEQQRLAHRRFGDWQNYSPDQRQRIIDRFQKFRRLPPARQRLLRKTYQRFQALPEARRKELRRRFAAMSDDERRAFLQGLQAGQASDHSSDRPRGQASDKVRPLASMAPSQARWFRQTAADLSPAARRSLQAMLVAGDAQAWNRLERRLAAMDRRQREAWLTAPEREQD